MAQDRHELLLWITGTGGKGHDAQGFSSLAADLGYHVVTLMFPDDIPASACANDSDPKSFEAFRMAVIQGGHATYQDGRKEISVERSESIENRLIKLLQHLQKNRPKENWRNFLAKTARSNGGSIAVAAGSITGRRTRSPDRNQTPGRPRFVLSLLRRKITARDSNAPAAWYGDASATLKGRFFAFNHHQDPKGCTPRTVVCQNLKALGLDAFGSPAEVDTEAFPYRHARILYTSYPIVYGNRVRIATGPKLPHGTAINPKNADRWKQVWTYLLTEETR